MPRENEKFSLPHINQWSGSNAQRSNKDVSKGSKKACVQERHGKKAPLSSNPCLWSTWVGTNPGLEGET